MNWEKFDENVDLNGLQEDIKKADENTGDYDEVPVGVYEVQPEKMELVETKESHKPMVSIWFKITSGRYAGQFIFYNQVVSEAFQISIVKRFLTSMECGTFEFKSYAKLAYDLDMLKNRIDEEELGFILDYGKNKKGYSTFKIKEVFEA